MDDSTFMEEALTLAKTAFKIGEIPVGAVVVRDSDGKIIGRGYNMRETERNAVCHAEIKAINEACQTLGGWRLSGCTLYVTLEPCPMCAGAVINSRLDRVVFGAYDKKAGSAGSVINLFELDYNHKPELVGGVMKEKCAGILSDFFTALREKNSNIKLIQVLTDEQIIRTTSLANEIWHEWFPSIISTGQIDYMVEKFQSKKAIEEQINNQGYYYYILKKNGNDIGYTAFCPQNDGRLFLSKIYIKKDYRGMGNGKQVFNFLDNFCRSNNLNAVWLTVNKNNTPTIEAYKKSGFKLIGEGIADIGGGYVMDDYYFERIVEY